MYYKAYTSVLPLHPIPLFCFQGIVQWWVHFMCYSIDYSKIKKMSLGVILVFHGKQMNYYFSLNVHICRHFTLNCPALHTWKQKRCFANLTSIYNFITKCVFTWSDVALWWTLTILLSNMKQWTHTILVIYINLIVVP